jgi:hypothetical protein
MKILSDSQLFPSHKQLLGSPLLQPNIFRWIEGGSFVNRKLSRAIN